MRQRLVLAVLVTTAACAMTACATESGGGAGTPSATSSAATSGPSATDYLPATPSSTASSTASGTSTAAVGKIAGCAPSDLKTYAAGQLTVATDTPAYPPWFVDNDPANGKGYESAVAFAVAKELGYTTGQVHWVHASFDSVVAPTPKQFDFDINQVSITAKRAQVVDFSSGYYDVVQAVVTLKNSKYANATSVAALQGAKLAAQQGTTSLDAINDVLKTGVTPAEYPTNDLAVQALKNGQVDGLVVDLPTAFYVTSAQVTDAKIVGQLAAGANPEQFGLVLDHGSSLTPCVSKAVDALRKDGTLAALKKRWLTQAGDAPVLKQ